MEPLLRLDAGPIKMSKTRLILGNDLQDGAVGEVVELSAGPQEYPPLMVGLRMGWPRVSVSEGGVGGCGPVAGPHGEQGQEGRWEAVVNSSLEIPAEVRKAPSLPAPCPGRWVPGTVGDSWLTLCLQEWTAGERLLSGHLLPLPRQGQCQQCGQCLSCPSMSSHRLCAEGPGVAGRWESNDNGLLNIHTSSV